MDLGSEYGAIIIIFLYQKEFRLFRGYSSLILSIDPT